MAIFAPALSARDRYEVYARWKYWPDYADNAPFVIRHEEGGATVRMNQSASGLSNQWSLLGTFTLDPDEDHRLELQDDANGTYVIADAARFVAVAEAKAATWEIPGSLIPETGSYSIYAKWPASPQNATNAPYTVTHAGGASTIIVNQRVNGGQWNLLGTFTFDAAGTGYKVELSDAGAAGTVAADAIYIAPAGAPSSDAFVWTPAIPSSGIYQVYARWPASSANTGAAQYTVTHAGGTANVTLNQKQNGGTWVALGSWSFAPGSGHKVTLAASAEGTTIADAMLFVAAGAQPANLLYVHADHLGSPQKLTDASQATVWDGVFDPFGEEVAVTGLAAMPLRFPGQYADEETGFNYNYFRDYEPRVGRYVQSDPVGLMGGINTFAYAKNNAVRLVDPNGLDGQFPLPGIDDELANGAYTWLDEPEDIPAIPEYTPLCEDRPSCKAIRPYVMAIHDTAVAAGTAIAAAGVGAEIGAARACQALYQVAKTRDPCSNPIILATVGFLICTNDPPDDFLRDLERLETIRRDSELAPQQTTSQTAAGR